MEKKNRKIMQIVLAALITLALWGYMEFYDSPKAELVLKDIPVEFTNEDTISAEFGQNIFIGKEIV